MANKKKEYYKPGPMTEGKRNIIQGLLQEYNIESAADIQEALKDRILVEFLDLENSAVVSMHIQSIDIVLNCTSTLISLL